MSLARSTLLFEWRRFLPALLSVAFAGLLMLVQLGLLMGLFGSVTVLVDSTAADIWLTAPATQSVDQSVDIPESLAAFIRTNGDIVGSESLLVRDASWRSADGARVATTLVGIRPSADALTCPQPLRATLCAALAEPDTVVVDQSEVGKLGTATAELIELNGHRMRVVGLSLGMRSIGTTYVFTSRQTMQRVLEDDASGSHLTTFVLAKTRDGARAEHVAEDLQQLLSRNSARAWTRGQLSEQSQRWWLKESGVGAGFLFSTLLGVLIAVVITSQTLRGVILSQVREYAAFRAIGVPAARLGGVIIEQAAWVGAAGSLLMLLLATLVALLAQYFYVPFILSPGAALTATAVGMLTSIASGLLALRELYRLQPAELLR